MQIETDEHLCSELQSLTTLHLREREYAYFVEFLAEVGFATVKAALKKDPDLTFGDLVMLRYRLWH